MDKEDKIYQQYENYFSLCKAVYENERAAILTFPGESWCKILPYVNGYDEGKLELYKYVKKHLKNERVPLWQQRNPALILSFTGRKPNRSLRIVIHGILIRKKISII